MTARNNGHSDAELADLNIEFYFHISLHKPMVKDIESSEMLS